MKRKEELEERANALLKRLMIKDYISYAHSVKTGYYAKQLAEEAGFSAEDVEIIYYAGLLHDVGKLNIPDSLLKRRGSLNDEEYRIVKTHVQKSIPYLKDLPEKEKIIPIILQHHEWVNGMGYPRGISGSNIPDGAKILCIADSFDAMTSYRPYHEAMPIEEAKNILINNSGEQFDKHFVEIFVEMINNGKIKGDVVNE